MMLNDHIARLTAAFAAGIAVLAWLLGGADTGIGAIAGGLVSVVNAFAMRAIATRLTSKVARTRTSAALLLASKLGIMAVVCWVFIARLQVDALGFALGTGALMFGMFVGLGQMNTSAQASEET